MERVNAIGRRKASIARVYLGEGTGKISVNKREHTQYFNEGHLLNKVLQPLQVTEAQSKFDISVNVYGGGIKGQAEAVKLAIARALLKVDPEYRALLKPLGILTRDPRVVERKKPGQPKARKKFQFSKR